ncbi:hypothetical protein FE257_000103 [Aspergillus nanangensis]|uniref:Uncharacterized protein n=1 Tax=Aspergillus nanangensis TaxID=2582783 RepID=A0AAD4CYS2_ASPNN|nr:hypothetical protein FE257_000103 [Aspergillus nanangensis]
MIFPQALLPLLLILQPVIAEDSDLSADLVGCSEVSCPKENAYDRCTVDNNTYLGIGLARIPDIPSSLEGLSLVRGVNVSDNSNLGNETTPRAFQSVYYLGAPSEMVIDELSGCAVLFNDPPAKKFSGSHERGASGSCSDVIEEDCIDALTRRGRQIADRQSGANHTCEAFKRDLDENPVEECSGYRGKDLGLGNFTVASLDNLTAADNSSSCWPITPKSDRLFEIGEYTALGNYSAEHILDKAYGISSVLTVVFGQGGNSSVDQATAQLTCLKVITEEEKPEDSETGSKGAASIVGYGSLTPWLAVLLGGLFCAL